MLFKNGNAMETESQFIPQNRCLKLLTEEPLILSACPGGLEDSLPYMEDVFTGHMDSNLRNRRFAKIQPQTEEVLVTVYEMYADYHSLDDVYNSFSPWVWELLSFESQGQIRMFVKEHPVCLADKNARTFFLCSEIGFMYRREFFSFSVSVDHMGCFKIDKHKHDNRPWSGKRKHRFVFPAKGTLVV